jgi:GDYXXLXY protein
MKTHTPYLWFALLLPIVAFTGLVVRAELLRASGSVFHVAIAGYDPRDLLQGHYLRYRLQWPADGACEDATCCLCLQTSGVHTKVACGVVDKTCGAQLSRPVVEQGREFFIQENAGPALEQAIRRGQGAIALNVTPNGQAHVHELFIDGVPHRRWLRDNAQRQ